MPLAVDFFLSPSKSTYPIEQIAFVLAVGVPAGVIAATTPKLADLAVGLAFLLVLVVSLFVSRPRPD
jgi:hypothetical protein